MRCITDDSCISLGFIFEMVQSKYILVPYMSTSQLWIMLHMHITPDTVRRVIATASYAKLSRSTKSLCKSCGAAGPKHTFGKCCDVTICLLCWIFGTAHRLNDQIQCGRYTYLVRRMMRVGEMQTYCQVCIPRTYAHVELTMVDGWQNMYLCLACLDRLPRV